MIGRLRLLLVFPLALLLHAVGFAFAHLAAPGHAQRNPLNLGSVDQRPLLTAYTATLQDGLGSRLPDGSALIERLSAALAASAALWLPALLLSTLIGVLIGRAAVDGDGLRIRPWLPLLSGLGLATPSFFFGALAISGVLIFLIVAPGRPLLFPLGGYGLDSHLVLPLIALSLRPTAAIAQLTAGLLLDELQRSYVTTARAYGVAEARIRSRHAWRNVRPALSSAVANNARQLVGELLLIEVLFAWPGIGALLAAVLLPGNSSIGGEGLLFLHAPTLAALLLLIGLLFMLTTLLSNWALGRLDPRVSHG
jgi:peptide/nickel transport system permease protein